MTPAAHPLDEEERLAALQAYGLLDTPPDTRFDAFTQAASKIFNAPIALISLIDRDRQWFKSTVGLDTTETPRAWAFCAHALADRFKILVVKDAARDARFSANPLVLGDPKIRFYAGAPLVDPGGHVVGTLCVIDTEPREIDAHQISVLRDLAAGVVSTMQLHRAMHEMRAAAARDQLTGLANREALVARIEEEIAFGNPCVLMCLDLEGFHQVNDLFGHAGGDAVLREAARRLRSVATEDEMLRADAAHLLARLSGDAFALLVSNRSKPDCAEAAASRIAAKLSEPFAIDGLDVSISVRAGIALHPAHATDAASLLDRADASLRRAKREGRGPVELYKQSIGVERHAARRLERDLRRALDGDQFRLHWQPIVRAADAAVAGREALLRWNRPEYGLSAPTALIETAETLGLIARIDQWVLREACRQAAAWPDAARAAVNVSASWFRTGDLPSLVEDVLIETGLPPDRLEIEVTERTLIDNEARAAAEFRRLRALAVRVSLDDFGTGYSSLAYLTRYRFDKIKLGGVFVSGIGVDAQSEVVTRAVLRLCATLGLPVCAEAVETQAQLDFLRAEGCAEVQGYLTGAPAPIDPHTIDARPVREVRRTAAERGSHGREGADPAGGRQPRPRRPGI